MTKRTRKAVSHRVDPETGAVETDFGMVRVTTWRDPSFPAPAAPTPLPADAMPANPFGDSRIGLDLWKRLRNRFVSVSEWWDGIEVHLRAEAASVQRGVLSICEAASLGDWPLALWLADGNARRWERFLARGKWEDMVSGARRSLDGARSNVGPRRGSVADVIASVSDWRTAGATKLLAKVRCSHPGVTLETVKRTRNRLLKKAGQ